MPLSFTITFITDAAGWFSGGTAGFKATPSQLILGLYQEEFGRGLNTGQEAGQGHQE